MLFYSIQPDAFEGREHLKSLDKSACYTMDYTMDVFIFIDSRKQRG